MNRCVRTLVVVVSTAGMVALAGTVGAQQIEGAPPGSQTGPEQGGAAPGGTAAPAACPAGSPLNLSELVGEAIAGLQLRPEQEAPLQQIGSQIDQAEAPVQSAKDDLLLSIADALDRGAVDRAALTPKVGALVDAQLRQKPAIEQALVALHDALDSQQRSQFVDALQAAMQGAMSPASSSRQNPGLALTNDQIRQLQALGATLQGGGPQQGVGPQPGGEPQPGGGPQQGSASQQPRIAQLLDAFRGDSFDPRTIAPEQGAATDAQQRAASILDVIDGLTRILTPDQRASLAATLRAGVQCDTQQGAPEQGAPTGGAAPTGGTSVGPGPMAASPDSPDPSDPPDATESVAQEQRRGLGGGVGGFGRGGVGGFGRGFGPGVGAGFGAFGRGVGPGVGVGGFGRGVGPGMGYGRFGRGFGPGVGYGAFGRGFGPGVGYGAFGRGFGPGVGYGGFGRWYGPGFGYGRFGHPGFYPGFNRGFFHGYPGPFFRGFYRGYFVPGFPFVATQVFAPFVWFAPFAQFSYTYTSSVDISIVLNAMFSTFAFF